MDVACRILQVLAGQMLQIVNDVREGCQSAGLKTQNASAPLFDFTEGPTTRWILNHTADLDRPLRSASCLPAFLIAVS